MLSKWVLVSFDGWVSVSVSSEVGVSPDALISVIDSEASVAAAVLLVDDVVDCPSVSSSAVRCDSEGCWLACSSEVDVSRSGVVAVSLCDSPDWASDVGSRCWSGVC
jgi:hypothetical protein